VDSDVEFPSEREPDNEPSSPEIRKSGKYKRKMATDKSEANEARHNKRHKIGISSSRKVSGKAERSKPRTRSQLDEEIENDDFFGDD
jgi:hypothetical protein